MITINANLESNYEISICPKCSREWYTIHYEQHGCTCLSEKERAKIEKQKQAWREMQARAAEKARLKRLELKGSKTPVFEKKPPQKSIKQVSEKQKQINEQLKKIKDEVTEYAINTNSHYCVGCGITALTLDRSHILSVKHRPDLQLCKSNIQLLCRKCHVIHESNNIEKMINLNCISETFEYIYKNDSERFQKLFHKLLDYYEKVKYPSVLKLITKIENFEQIEIF